MGWWFTCGDAFSVSDKIGMDKEKYSSRGFLKKGAALTGGSVALGAVGTASAATPNSIVTENQLTGSPQSQWDLGGTQGTGEGQYSGFGLGSVFDTGPIAGMNFIEGFPAASVSIVGRRSV